MLSRLLASERASGLAAYLLVLAIGLFSGSLAAAPPQSGKNNVWHKDTGSDIVLVFVHGFNSDSANSWQGENGQYWPDLIIEDLAFEKADVSLGGFFTSPFSRDYDIIEASKELYDALDRSTTSKRSVLNRPYIFCGPQYWWHHSPSPLVPQQYRFPR